MAKKEFESRDQIAGFRVPKGLPEQQEAYRESVKRQALLKSVEPIESLQERYGDIDPYTAKLFKLYHSAQGSDLKQKYADMIRRNVDSTTAERMIGPSVSAGEVGRMTGAIAETEPIKTYVDAAKTLLDAPTRMVDQTKRLID